MKTLVRNQIISQTWHNNTNDMKWKQWQHKRINNTLQFNTLKKKTETTTYKIYKLCTGFRFMTKC